MARINLKNISIDTLLSMIDDEILALAKRGLNKSSMTEKEYSKAHRNQLAEITSRFVSTANRRIKKLGASKIGQTSPSYQRAKAMSKSGLFSVKGKNWNDLRNTIKETRQFLESKTSTVKGWKNVRANIEADIGGELNSAFKSKKFWEAYRRLSEARGGLMGRKGSKSRLSSERVQQLLYNTITNKRDEEGRRVVDWRSKVDRIVEEADELLDREYKLEQRSRFGASNFVLEDDEED